MPSTAQHPASEGPPGSQPATPPEADTATPWATATADPSASAAEAAAKVDLETARKVFRLIDALDNDDDVQNVYANHDVPADVQAALDDEE